MLIIIFTTIIRSTKATLMLEEKLEPALAMDSQYSRARLENPVLAIIVA